MIRGRLVAINGQAVDGRATSPTSAPSAWSSASSTSATPPRCRRTTSWSAGRWTADEADALSVEEGLAQTLGLKLGDTLALRHRRPAARGPHHQPAQGRLGFDAGQLLRHVPARPRCPTCRSATSRLPRARTAPGFDNALSRDFPNITNVDVSASIAPGAARARPGDPRGRVPVRLHAGGRAGGAVRRRHRHARGARARVRA